MIRSGLLLTAALALLLAAMALKGALVPLPSPPETEAAPGFDANRAAERLSRILGDERPHPVDSAANDMVRERLLAELRALGLTPRVTDDFGCNSYGRSRTVTCARVRNVVATMGPAEGRHLLLSAHYDSTFAGPGAADAGIGVATLLEVAALLRDRPLQRPIALLFNDGEEMGLIGARAFLDRDPLAARIDAVVNLEARGVEGPAVMFETSRPNGPAIAAFARAVDRPVANSLTADLYRLIPNATDVVVFQERPWTILNFAIIGNETRYHSPGDDLSALDRSSLQHMGTQALALTRQFALEDPGQAVAGERLYADMLGLGLVTLPMMVGLAMLAALLLFFAVTAWRRGALGRPLIAVVSGLAGSALIAWASQLILNALRSGAYWRGYPVVTTTAVYATATAVIIAALVLIARRANLRQLRAAYWLAFMLCGAGISAVAPGGAIFFLFPPLLAATGMALAQRWPWAERAGAIGAILLLYLTFGPALALFEELMNNGPHWMFAPLGAIILLPALIELSPLFARIHRGLLLSGAVDLVLLAWVAVGLTPAYSVDRQQPFTVEYAWDADAQRGRWAISNDGAPLPSRYELAGPWTRGEVPYATRRRWLASAPTIDVPAPAVEQLGERPAQGGRLVRVRLRSGGAEALLLKLPPEARLHGVRAGAFARRIGRGAPDDPYYVRCTGRSCDGATLDLLLGAEQPVPALLVGVRSGLPPAGAPLIEAMPERARPQYGTHSSIVTRQVRL